MAKDSLTITDNRTGTTYELPIENDTIRALDLRQIKVQPDDFGMMTYDPAYQNTASCRSAITYIDGAKGVLLYRGYPIEQITESCSFLEVAYLLIYGELPKKTELDQWRHEVTHHTYVHENVLKFMDGFRYDAHPMSQLVSTIGALSSFYPNARDFMDPKNRRLQIVRLIAKMPTLAAWSYRQSMGLPIVYPDNALSYTGNFLSMVKKMSEPRYEPDPVFEHALDALFVLHADHEQNCSTSTMRAVGSSKVDPYSAVSAAAAALYGPLHGGANEAVVRMLEDIGDPKEIPKVIDQAKRGERRLMGFGHRVYKAYDPRAAAIKSLAHQVFQKVGANPMLDIALELERYALEDDYFVERKLFPNVDFYSGLIYQAMGFPKAMFTVLFAIARCAGWLAQWSEMVDDKDQKIARPRQVYIGSGHRDFVPVEKR